MTTIDKEYRSMLDQLVFDKNAYGIELRYKCNDKISKRPLLKQLSYITKAAILSEAEGSDTRLYTEPSRHQILRLRSG
ncbi:MAG: hypothetical protein BMS9Abin19_0981 [Gammaproteobacteria bacterium]|nr:MAG: hypothetical protein BMS9Abin19_0981 [Gammaproteobacteria bacterium]